MKSKIKILLLSGIILIPVLVLLAVQQGDTDTVLSSDPYPYFYPWPHGAMLRRVSDIPVPAGYRRVVLEHPSFGGWLRGLPLLSPGAPVLLHNGQLKPDQTMHYAVLDMETGERDLQQCADALMRLRAEYLFSISNYQNIRFQFVSGFRANYLPWREGARIQVNGNNARWVQKTSADSSWGVFRQYLTRVYEYANSWSLEQETTAVPRLQQIRVGDIFLQGGFPGHGVMIVDMAVNDRGQTLFLIAQSYMPAQSIHILKSFERVSPWYPLDFGDTLLTPTWEFRPEHLRRFP